MQDVKTFGKLIWFGVIILATLLCGIIIGQYLYGQSLEKKLDQTNVSICKDIDGKYWIKESAENNLPRLNLSLSSVEDKKEIMCIDPNRKRFNLFS